MHRSSTKPINLATLAWLDRRRIWATTGRGPTLGVSSIPANPSLVGGQGSRPSVAHRHFSPSFTWALNALTALSSALLALYLVLGASHLALSSALPCALTYLDSSLHPRGPSLPPLLGHGGLGRAPRSGPATPDITLIGALYSVIGALEATSACVPPAPTCQNPLAVGDPRTWAALKGPTGAGWLRALTPLTAQLSSPLFKAHLGEWHRLLDQSSDASALHCQWLVSGLAISGKTRLGGEPAAAKTCALISGVTSIAPLAGAGPLSYGPYLSSPWRL